MSYSPTIISKWQASTTSQLFQKHLLDQKYYVATAGSDPTYSEKFQKVVKSFHENAQDWNLAQHRALFNEGLCRYYFCHLLAERCPALSEFHTHVQSYLTQNEGQLDRSKYFDHCISHLFFRWTHRSLHTAKDDRKMELGSLKRLFSSEETDTSSARKIFLFVAEDELIQQFGALCQKLSFIEKHPENTSDEQRDNFWEELEMSPPNPTRPSEGLSTVGDKLTEMLCYRMMQYLEVLDSLIIFRNNPESPLSTDTLLEIIDDHDWSPIRQQSREEFEEDFSKNFSIG